MKKIFLLMLIFPVLAFSQWIDAGSSDGVQIYKIENWSPFASDSSAYVSTSNLSIPACDSVVLATYPTSVNGSPKFYVTLQGSMGAAASFDSLGRLADTTNVKLEAMKFNSGVSTKGARIVKATLLGNPAGGAPSAYNRKDVIVNMYLICFLRKF